MTARTVARRYGAALFEVTRRAGTEARAGRDLAALVSLVTGHAELRRVFETPTIPLAIKKSVAAALLEGVGEISVEVHRMVLLLAERDRLAVLPAVADEFSSRLLRAQNIVPAEVVTAVPLSEANREALVKALGLAAGGQVILTERIDPAIIGGVVAKVGSVVFDGSITRQLERLGQQLRTET